MRLNYQEQAQRTYQDAQQGKFDPTNNFIASPNSNKAMYYSLFFIIIASLSAYFHIARNQQQTRPFFDTQTYYSQSNPKIYAGEIHYSRIPVQYWQHRIQMIKAMGLNSLSIYIMWNYHQIQKGKFDFQTGNRNLTKFLFLAEKYQMKVLIRPGPYVCAEWDFGGLPARLLSIEGLDIRSSDKLFLDEVEIYFEAVAPILIQHIWTTDKPQNCIIMLQIQNQYGFYSTDITYIMALRNIWHKLHVNTAEYYVDWFVNIRKSHWPGANVGLNNAFNQFHIDYIKLSLENVGMVFGGEIYSGWLTHWRQTQMQKKDSMIKVKQYGYIMDHNISFAMYVAHGGSNFGLTAGANANFRQQIGFTGHVTSYDYDAPISQQGSITQKYKIFQQQILKHVDWQVPDIPDPIPMIKIPAFTPTLIGSIYDSIDWDEPFLISNKFYPFQSNQLKMFNQGIVIYRTTIPANSHNQFIIQLHDLGYILIDGKFQTFLDRSLYQHHTINLTCNNNNVDCILDLMVQAMGHDNYDRSMKQDYKGLIKFENITNKKQIFQWKIYRINIANFTEIQTFTTLPENYQNTLKNMSVLLKSQIMLQEIGDTYLNMTSYQKGYIWVNGHNLGRYWTVGPQYKIFCPGVWLNSGINHIYILEMLYDNQHKHSIRGQLTLEQKQDD